MLYKSRFTLLTSEPFPDRGIRAHGNFRNCTLMKDNGADGGTRANERRAALKYFAGSNWNKAANAFYGDSVMGLADKIQAEIDILNQ